MIKAKCPENLKWVHRSRLKKIIVAMELLLRHYRTRGGLEEVSNSCPLCVAADRWREGWPGNCSYCPWSVIAGLAICTGLVFYDHSVAVLRGGSDSRWNKKRRRELPRWIEWYEAELERRADIVVTRMKRSRL